MALEIDTACISQQNFIGEAFFQKNKEENPSLSQVLDGIRLESEL